jgi:hypothetical protein
VHRAVCIALVGGLALASTAWPAVAAGEEPVSDPAATTVAAPSATPEPTPEPTPPPGEQPAPDAASGGQPAPDAPSSGQPAPDPAAGGESAAPGTPSGAQPAGDPPPQPPTTAPSAADGAEDAEPAAEAPVSTAPHPAPAPAEDRGAQPSGRPAPPVRAVTVPMATRPVREPAAEPIAAHTVAAPTPRFRRAFRRPAWRAGDCAPLAVQSRPALIFVGARQPDAVLTVPSARTRAERAGEQRRKAAPAPRASERRPTPPFEPARDGAAATAAGPGTTAPPALACTLPAAFAAMACLELRRFGARRAVPDAPDVFSLRDRPG